MQVITLTCLPPSLTGGSGGPGAAPKAEKPVAQTAPKPTPPPPKKTETPKPQTKVAKPEMCPRLTEKPKTPDLEIPLSSRPVSQTKASTPAATAVANLPTGARPGQGTGRGPGSSGGSGGGQGGGLGANRGSASGGGQADHLRLYLAEIRRLLEKNRYYPPLARRQHLEGVVTFAELCMSSSANWSGIQVDIFFEAVGQAAQGRREWAPI